ncbi:transposase [Chryseobacterium wanjuense]
MKIETLEFGYFYHIYNRGNNSGTIFFEEKNYNYFLQLLSKYIVPIGEIYAYCLLKNHFHFLIKLKDESEISYERFCILNDK